MTKHEKELQQIQGYIDTFDVNEFSSDEKIKLECAIPVRVKRARKLKAKIVRKRQMEDAFNESIDECRLDGCEIMITQEQIDDLLLAHL